MPTFTDLHLPNSIFHDATMLTGDMYKNVQKVVVPILIAICDEEDAPVIKIFRSFVEWHLTIMNPMPTATTIENATRKLQDFYEKVQHFRSLSASEFRKVIKFHFLSFYAEKISRFGSPANTDTSLFETAHIDNVKRFVKNTNHHANCSNQMIARLVRESKLSSIQQRVEGQMPSYLQQRIREETAFGVRRGTPTLLEAEINFGVQGLIHALSVYMHSSQYGVSARISIQQELPWIRPRTTISVFDKSDIPMTNHHAQFYHPTSENPRDIVTASKGHHVFYRAKQNKIGIAKIRLFFVMEHDWPDGGEAERYLVLLQPLRRVAYNDAGKLFILKETPELIVGESDCLVRRAHLISVGSDDSALNPFADSLTYHHYHPLYQKYCM